MVRIAVVNAQDGGSESLSRMASAFAREFVAMGHFADIVTRADHGRLSEYDFIVVCSTAESLTGALGSAPSEILAHAGSIEGKRSMAIVRKSGLMPGRTLAKLMKAMESHGMIVTCGEVLADAAVAAAARDAPLKRN